VKRGASPSFFLLKKTPEYSEDFEAGSLGFMVKSLINMGYWYFYPIKKYSLTTQKAN